MTANTRGMSAALLGAALLLWSAPTAAQILGQDNITANGQAVAFMAIPANTGAVTFTISGTWTGTLQLEVTADGTNWVAAAALPSSGGATVSSTTGTGVWSILNYGFVGFRARASAFASGTAVISATAGKQVTLSGAVTVSDITSSGRILLANGTANAPSLSFSGATTNGLWNNAGLPTFSVLGSARVGWGSSTIGMQLDSAYPLSWSGTTPGNPSDVLLFRDGAGALGLRQGANQQRVNIYNTYTDASNYERGFALWNANAFVIGTEFLGSGSVRSMAFSTPASGNIFMSPGNSDKWMFQGLGHITAVTDNVYDIGASGANRPRNLFLGGTVTAGGTVNTGANFGMNSGGSIVWASRSVINSPADGVVTLLNNTSTDFTRLNFGGTTSAFPAIFRNSNFLQIGLADGTGASTAISSGSISSGQVQVSGQAITAGSGAGITLNNAGTTTRQVYKVTITPAAFICNAVTCDITIATIPDKTLLAGVLADMTQVFACAAVCTSATLSFQLGTGSGGTQFLASFDADAAIGRFGTTDAQMGTLNNRAAAVQGGVWISGGTQTVVLRLTSGTGVVGTGAATNLSQGSITFYLITDRLP